MSNISISSDGRQFTKDGKRFFLMADACWSAFTNMKAEEWEKYLLIRSSQGYNTVLLSILPQWDRGLGPGESVCPFFKPGQEYLRFSDIPKSYFDHICDFLAVAKRYDITPVLVFLWANYTNGTYFDNFWGRVPMAPEDVSEYIRYAAERFKPYEPVYFISGDTDFTELVVDEYYLPALTTLKEIDPTALAALHLCGDGFLTAEEIEHSIPARLLYDDRLDFYVYQSGHLEPWLDRCTACARAFRQLKKTKPVLNIEPCYEGWETGSTSHGRRHLRQSAWLSVLSGADAGLGHGVHGIWQWYRRGDFFAPHDVKGQKLLYTCERPFEAWEAMKFTGAEDRSFVRFILEKYDISDLNPDERVEADTALTKLALGNGGATLLLYIPRNQETRINVKVDRMKFDLYDLKRRELIPAGITQDAQGFTLSHPGVNNDTLLVGYQV